VLVALVPAPGRAAAAAPALVERFVLPVIAAR
jgi:hypothetical protein